MRGLAKKGRKSCPDVRRKPPGRAGWRPWRSFRRLLSATLPRSFCLCSTPASAVRPDVVWMAGGHNGRLLTLSMPPAVRRWRRGATITPSSSGASRTGRCWRRMTKRPARRCFQSRIPRTAVSWPRNVRKARWRWQTCHCPDTINEHQGQASPWPTGGRSAVQPRGFFRAACRCPHPPRVIGWWAVPVLPSMTRVFPPQARQLRGPPIWPG